MAGNSNLNSGFFDTQFLFVCDQVSLEILDVNEPTVQYVGIPKDQLLDVTLYDLVTEVPLQIADEIKRHQRSSTFDKVWSLKSVHGDEKVIQFSTHVITYKNKPAKLLIAHDLTSIIYENDEELISSPIGFQGFPLAEIEWKYSGEILRWSDKATELFGWEEEEVIYDHHLLQDFVYEEDLDLVWGSFKKLAKEKQESFSLINRNVTKNGSVVYSEWYNSILYDKEGRVLSVYSLVANVTDRVIAFKESEKSMQSYRDLFDSMSEAIYLLDHENKILIANKGVKATYGYEPEEIVSNNQSMLRAPGKFDANEMDRIREVSEQQEAQKMEVWSKKANGEVFLTEMLVNKGSYFGQSVLIIIERDISDRKFAEEELIRREKFFSELFNTTPLAITMLNAHNEVELVNEGFESLFGYYLDEIQGLEIDRIIVPGEDYEDAVRISNSPLVEVKQVKRLSKSNQLLDVIVYSVPVIIDEKIEAKFGLYVDITERERVEETVRKSLKEKELLLAEVHHRVKNNLAVITGLLELQSYATDNTNAHDVLNDSRHRIHSIALVHEKLYQNENLSDIEVGPYINELVESLQKSFKTSLTKVEVGFDIDPVNLIITQAIPCGLLINEIVTNAYKHAFKDREKGKVTISFKKKKELLVLSIKDDGIGFDSMNYSKGGSSLGMKLIRTISKQLKAEAETLREEGTEFIFRFEKAYI